MLNIVLIEPEIPPNTGNIGRLCVGAGARLHLVKPLGFLLDDASRRRAGLDYWEHLDWQLWENWDELRATAGDTARFWYFTTKTTRPYWSATYGPDDWLVFGRETRGLPESLLQANEPQCLTIPMRPEARSLNLATSVGIGLYEAVRQAHQASEGVL
jgi:tRNA (cytidine/uridine-2'-O-)-methyltransferase